MNNREIKFRAFDTQRNEMYNDKCIESINFLAKEITFKFDIDIVDGQNSGHYTGSFERFALMLFTGLNDIYGMDIYEGDIMGSGKVIWDTFKSGFILEGEDWEHDMGYAKSNYAVIGNIYENPGLVLALLIKQL